MFGKKKPGAIYAGPQSYCWLNQINPAIRYGTRLLYQYAYKYAHQNSHAVLDQVRRQNSSTVAVVIGNRCGEGRNRNTVLYCISNDITQRLLVVIGNLLEVRSQQQVSDLRIFGISIGDFLQELRTDDAASTENLRDFAVVQIPVVLFRRSTQLREARA